MELLLIWNPLPCADAGMHGNAGIFVKAGTYMSSVIWNSALRAAQTCHRPRQLRVTCYRGRDSICRRYRRKAPVR